MAQITQTIIASMNNCPPSLSDFIPSMVRCDRMAPDIKPKPKKAPVKAVDGMSNSMPATSSIMPVPIRPQGSTPVC